ncbi:MAG TPA: hypothetical protein VMS98_08685 [Thermoanaerobaculia bacterium]|nr:hypothetical protein [Thermoanaerobaculia bacterium]
MRKSSMLTALTTILGRPNIDELMKQIRDTIGSRPHAMDAASGRRLLGSLLSGRRETEQLMRRLGRSSRS